MEAARLEMISRQFLPSRWYYHYARIKLATDPLYAAAASALAVTHAPLLDLGCGIGLLAHYCHASGLELPYHGVDNDTAKVALATVAATRAGLQNTQFDVVDLARGFPAHQGSVVIFDMLQFLTPERVPVFLEQAAACVTDEGCLLIRTGVQDAGWRTHVTRAADWFARLVHWMNAAPLAYPRRELLHTHLAALGFVAEFTPLWGNTPFNNWLIVARRR